MKKMIAATLIGGTHRSAPCWDRHRRTPRVDHVHPDARLRRTIRTSSPTYGMPAVLNEGYKICGVRGTGHHRHLGGGRCASWPRCRCRGIEPIQREGPRRVPSRLLISETSSHRWPRRHRDRVSASGTGSGGTVLDDARLGRNRPAGRSRRHPVADPRSGVAQHLNGSHREGPRADCRSQLDRLRLDSFTGSGVHGHDRDQFRRCP